MNSIVINGTLYSVLDKDGFSQHLSPCELCCMSYTSIETGKFKICSVCNDELRSDQYLAPYDNRDRDL